MMDVKISGITSSLPKVNADAKIWVGALTIFEKVCFTNSRAGSGT